MIDADMRCAHRELAARLRPFVARRVSTPADTDDVLQDVFLRMQRSGGELRDEERFGPWIYRVARSALADHARARARHPLANAEVPDAAADSIDGEDDGSVEARLAACVPIFVAMLPSPYREALTLTELEGLTQKEAAEMLGISVSGMKSRVQRGRERLRTMFDECCEIAVDARGRAITCEPRGTGRPPSCGR